MQERDSPARAAHAGAMPRENSDCLWHVSSGCAARTLANVTGGQGDAEAHGGGGAPSHSTQAQEDVTVPQPRVLAVMLRSMARQTSAREGCCSTGAGGTLRALSACVPAPTARGLVCCQSRGRSCAVRRRTCSRAAPSSRAQRGGGRMNGHTAQHPGRAMSARARRPPALRRVQLAARSPALPASPSASSLAAGRAGHWPPLPRTTSTSRSSAAVGRQSAASRACLTCLTTGHRPLTTASDHLLPACCPPAARPAIPRLACALPGRQLARACGVRVAVTRGLPGRSHGAGTRLITYLL